MPHKQGVLFSVLLASSRLSDFLNSSFSFSFSFLQRTLPIVSIVQDPAYTPTLSVTPFVAYTDLFLFQISVFQTLPPSPEADIKEGVTDCEVLCTMVLSLFLTWGRPCLLNIYICLFCYLR